MRWWERPVWTLDLETTGADPLTAQIVEWALLRVAPTGHVLEARGGIVKAHVPAEAAAVHGITNDVTRWGMAPLTAVRELLVGLWDARRDGEPVVVFNAPYDLTVLASVTGLAESSAALDGVLFIDPLVIDRHCDRYRRGSRRLEDVCHRYGVEGGGWHSASGDALAAALLAFAIGEQQRELHALTLEELHAAQVAWAAKWAEGLQAHKRRTGEPGAVVDGSWPVRSLRKPQSGSAPREGIGEGGTP